MIGPVRTTVEVNARLESIESGLAMPYHFTRSEVLSSAGTWGDFTRYLQLLPGVVWNTDLSNDVMVRGGNPYENLYVVDGIEVPNINHIALEGTTGGFTSMIDTTAVRSVDLEPGVYDAQYSSRLSSMIEIDTRDSRRSEAAEEVDVGITGAGALVSRPLGSTGDVMVTGHRSVLNLVTNDIGLNGVPIYTNGLATAHWTPDSKDRISMLSLSGADSLHMTPSSCDQGLTTPDETLYGGFRSTNGLNWQHVFSAVTVSTLTVSYSTQSQNIGQWLIYDNCKSGMYRDGSVYSEQTWDGTPTVEYGVQTSRQHWLFSVGAVVRMALVNYAVAQPMGQQSPFSANPAWTDADNFKRIFGSGETASYAEATGSLGRRWTFTAGAREETFALTGSHEFEPRASAAFRISRRQAVNVSIERASQLPPTIDILSYQQNGRLGPIRVLQIAAGADLWRGEWVTASVQAYHKAYTDEPVSTEYPSLMLANMVDTLGQQFILLPLRSGGTGRANGIDLMVRAHVGERVELLSTASFSKTQYAAGDGILRSGNFDLPFVGNGMITVRLPWKLEGAFRDTYASGRPYTPFNIALSEQQSRGIYDLTRINAARGSAYNRVDADFHRSIHVGHGMLKIYGGMENLLNRGNFLGYLWEDYCPASQAGNYCGLTPNAIPGVPETKVLQMPGFPSAGVHYSF